MFCLHHRNNRYLLFLQYGLQSAKANGIRTLFEAAGKNITIMLHGTTLYDVLGGHIISHITLFAEMWNA